MTCSVDCGKYGSCVADVCVCTPPFTSVAEGISEMGCRLDGDVLTVLWMITFVLTLFGCVFCVCKLCVGLSGHPEGLLWNKVVKDTVFRVVLCTAVLDGSLALYAGVRLFAGLYYLHDYLAVLLFYIPFTMLWVQLAALARLFRKMVKTLVHASGSTNFKADNRRQHTALNVIGCVLLLPSFAGPALPASARVVLLRYFLVYIVAMGLVSVYLLVSIAHRGISVLKTLGTDMTMKARRKLQGITIYFYVVVCAVLPVMLVLAASDLIVDGPYIIATLGVLLGVGPLPRAAMLRFDMKKFRKGSSKRPSSGSKRDTETAASSTEKSTVQSSNEKSTEVGLEAQVGDVATPITANRRLGDSAEAPESPVLGGRRLGGAAAAGSGDSWLERAHERESELPRDSDIPHIIDVGR